MIPRWGRQVTHLSTPRFAPRTIRWEACCWVATTSLLNIMPAGDSPPHVLEFLIPPTEVSRLTPFRIPDLRVNVSTIPTQPRAFIAHSGRPFAIRKLTTLPISNSLPLKTQPTGRPANLIYRLKG